MRYAATLSNPRPHKTNLRTATGSLSRSSHSGKLQVTRGPAPIFLPELAVPTFQDNLLSVGQLAEQHNVVFTKEGVFLAPRRPQPYMATKLGARGPDNLYTLAASPTPTALAAPVLPKPRLNPALYQTINHATP